MELVIALAELRALVIEYAQSGEPIDLEFIVRYVDAESELLKLIAHPEA